MRYPRHAKIFRGQFEAVPYASVFFLLLMFLIFSSSLVFTPGVRIELPEAKDLPGTLNPTLVVAVDSQAKLYYESQGVDEDRLKETLVAEVRRSKTPLTLLVQADKAVSYDVIVRLARIARDAGMHETLFATRPGLFSQPPVATNSK